MTEEQALNVLQLANAWSMASFVRGNDRGENPELADADRAASRALLAYMRELIK